MNSRISENVRLLPGAGGPASVPRRAALRGTEVEIHTARRRAAISDVVDAALLGALDLLFISWPAAHVPWMSRDHSVAILIFVHMVIFAHCLFARWYPRWNAMRIATTWSHQEQRHLIDTIVAEELRKVR
ncbi:MAG: hypothetical protein WBX15_07060 [Thermoanaerobaculia bacterium]